ncbi:TonB-dependent siderophore receptor [Stutzerimonas tarimensis]|uniref:TonB-dependent siderophore receptor n=1 Tax=Stutzerimonas tarimensis TaxID=1507735 RepID=A0ABV7TBV7_9GAMM
MSSRLSLPGLLASGTLLGLVSAGAQAQDTGSAVLETMTITTEQETATGPVTGYRAQRSASATGTDTPISETPQSLSVIPAQVLEDLDSPRIERALDFAGGVARQNDFGGLTLYGYSVRGLATSEFYKDGYSVNRGYMNSPDAANIERVEVLKGPVSSLYGRGDPGGTINIVSKRPQSQPFTRIDLSAGRWDRYRSTLDVNTPLDDEATMALRLNAALEDHDSFRDHRAGERQLLAPSFSWTMSPDTRLLMQAEVVRNRQVFDRGVLAPGNRLGLVQRSAYFGEPSDGYVSNNNETLQAELEHDLNDGWSLRLAKHYKQGRLNGYATESAVLQADQRTLARDLRYRDSKWQDAITQFELRGQIYTGDIEHNLLIGAEYERYALDQRLLRSADTRLIDIYMPVYGRPRPAFVTGPDGRSTHINELVYNRALNLQNQLRLNDRLSALIGARYDHYDQRLDNEVAGTRAEQTHEKITPRVGALYQLTPEVGLFANASRSFKPNGGAGANGSPFDPEEGIGYEAGVKFDLLDNRLGITLAAFHLSKKNVLTADRNETGFSIAAGEVRSRGFDAQFSGQLTDAIRVIGAYAYVDAEVRRDNTLEVGGRLLNVPRHSGSLMTVYDFQDGHLHGLEVGGAVNYVGNRAGETENPDFELPSYATVDLLARYKATDNLTLGLNLNNAFDRTYYERSYSNLWVMPGEPRNLAFSLSLNL